MKRAKKLLALLCALCLMAAAAPAALADPWGIYDYAVVSGTSSLNLRAGPSSAYAWLGSAPEGTTRRVTMKGPFRLMSIMASHSSSVISCSFA